jgi:serine/threonine protein phosphatase PrpC
MSKLNTFSVTATGASHIKEEKVCQDFALSSEGSDYAVAIVCDGHGGNKYFRSNRGSRIAAEQAHTAIREFMKSRFAKSQQGGKVVDTLLSNPETYLNQLAANIIYRWREAIAGDTKFEPFTESEKAILTPKELTAFQIEEGWVSAYGTTLIAVVRAKEFWFGLHIGDGKCVAIDSSSEYTQPIPWDEKCFLNQTTSLCDENALSRFRYYFSKENLPIAIFIASDGVDDTFGTDEALHDFYKTILQLFSTKGKTDGVAELQTYIPQLSAKGSQDDISIAGILVRKELIKTK